MNSTHTARPPSAPNSPIAPEAKDRPSQIAALEPGRSICLRSQQGGVTADYTYSLQAAGPAATKVRLVAQCRTTGGWRLVAPLLRAAMRRADRHQLDNLKAHLDGDPR